MHVHIRTRARVAADAIELARDLDVVEPLAGVRMKLLQLGGDDRSSEIVRHQAADDAGLDDVLAHPRKAGLGRLEVRRHHVAGADAVLHHLDEAHVRSDDGEDLGPVDTGQEEHRVGHLAQRGEELRGEHVAAARHQRDHHAVRAAELVAMLEEGPHVLVLDRHQLGESGIDPQPRREPPHRQGDEHERREHEAAPGEQQSFDAIRHKNARRIRPLAVKCRGKSRSVARDFRIPAEAGIHSAGLGRPQDGNGVIDTWIIHPGSDAARRTRRSAARRRPRAATRPRSPRETAASGSTRCARRPGWSAHSLPDR